MIDVTKAAVMYLRLKGYEDAADDLEATITSGESLIRRASEALAAVSDPMGGPPQPGDTVRQSVHTYGTRFRGSISDLFKASAEEVRARHAEAVAEQTPHEKLHEGRAAEFPNMGGDSVVLPHHYGRWNIEAIRFIVENNGPGFLYENATKYLWRYDAKNGHEDLAKAARYIEMLRMYEAGYENWHEPYAGQALPDFPTAVLRSRSREA